MAKLGKRYLADQKSLGGKEEMPLKEAVEAIKQFQKAKFDQSVDLSLHLGIDPKQADQAIRGSLSLPHGIGKTKRVVAFCTEDKVAAAKEAGALEAGGTDLIKKIKDGWMDFDVAVASPDMMRVVSPLGRTLGPRGLMPSPKSGTVTPNIIDAVKEYAAGKVEYRNDSGGNIHALIGKFSFDADKLVENAEAFIQHIENVRPVSTKGLYLKKVSISGTMTPGITVVL